MGITRIVYAILVISMTVLEIEFAESRPAEEATKFNLDSWIDSTERNGQSSPTTWEQGMELLGRFGDAIRFGRGKLINSAVMARNIITEGAEQSGRSARFKGRYLKKRREKQDLASEARKGLVASVVAAKSDILAQGSTAVNSLAGSLESILPAKSRETVRLENENAQAPFEVKKQNPIASLIEMYLRPTALVDKIREEDKYGNSGDKLIGLGRALVGGFEGLSNFLNTVIDFPIDTAKKTSRGVSKALNELGGRLVGLQ